MQIICKDGTSIKCRDFEATDSGVLFYQETPGRDEDDEEEDDEEAERRASGFVPVTELQFVLPDEMVQRARGQRAGGPEGTPAPAPDQGPGATRHQQGQGHRGSSAPAPPPQQGREPGRR